MNSYNNIVKMKYNSNSDDVVSLIEYIIFEDTLAEDKYIVFKFINNLNQRLKAIRVDVAFLDENDNVLGKSIIEYNDFTALEHESFIPSAKLSCDFATKKIHVKLLYAKFDNVVYEDGNFREIDPKIDTVKEKKDSKTTDVKASTKTVTKQQSVNNGKKHEAKAGKSGYTVKNIFKRNFVKFPKVLNKLVVFGTVFASLSLAFYFTYQNSSKVFSDKENGFSYQLISNGTEYALIGYDGKEDEASIPAYYNNLPVTKVSKNAFNFSFVKKISYEGSNLLFEDDAIKNCILLNEICITNGDSISFASGSISSCPSLKVIDCENVTFASNSIKGIRKLDKFVIGNTGSNTLGSVFDTKKEVNIGEVRLTSQQSLTDKYLSNLKIDKLYTADGYATYSYSVFEHINRLNDAEVKTNGSIAYSGNKVIAVNNSSTATSLVIPDTVTEFNAELIDSANQFTSVTYNGTYSGVISASIQSKLTNLAEIHVKNISTLTSLVKNVDIYTEGGSYDQFAILNGKMGSKKLTITGGYPESYMLQNAGYINELVFTKDVTPNMNTLSGVSCGNLYFPCYASAASTTAVSLSYYGIGSGINYLHITEGTATFVPNSYITGGYFYTLEFDDSITKYGSYCIQNCGNLHSIKFSNASTFDEPTKAVISNCYYLNTISLNISNYSMSLATFTSNSGTFNKVTVYGATSSSTFFNCSCFNSYSNTFELNIYGSSMPSLTSLGAIYGTITIGTNSVGGTGRLSEIIMPSALMYATVKFDNTSLNVTKNMFDGITIPSNINNIYFIRCNPTSDVFDNAANFYSGSVYWYSTCTQTNKTAIRNSTINHGAMFNEY